MAVGVAVAVTVGVAVAVGVADGDGSGGGVYGESQSLEFLPDALISYAWLQQYGLPTDGSADYTDPDGDGLNNWQEWRAGTDPTNSLSALRMLSPSNSFSGLVIRWQSVNGVIYYLQRSTNLATQPAFSILQSNIVGQAGTTTYTDTNAAGPGPFFYRVEVGN